MEEKKSLWKILSLRPGEKRNVSFESAGSFQVSQSWTLYLDCREIEFKWLPKTKPQNLGLRKKRNRSRIFIMKKEGAAS